MRRIRSPRVSLLHEIPAALTMPHGPKIPLPDVVGMRDARASAAMAAWREMGGFLLDGYDPGNFYCELLRSPGNFRLRDRLAGLSIADFKRRAASAEQALYNLGIPFTVYSDGNAIDRILPFDAIPRVLSAAEWADRERGVIQRVNALNLLIE